MQRAFAFDLQQVETYEVKVATAVEPIAEQGEVGAAVAVRGKDLTIENAGDVNGRRKLPR